MKQQGTGFAPDLAHDRALDLAPELAALLAPLAGAQPCGVSLRYADTYRLVDEARREDDLSLPQGIWQQPPKRADWQAVERLCMDALRERSKDLQIASWLCEAWVHLGGLDGLCHGLQLLAALLDKYWAEIHPQMEEGDLGFRSAPFDWLNKNINRALLQVPLAAGRGAAGQPYSLGQWAAVLRTELQAVQLGNGKDRPAPGPEQLTRTHFGAAVAALPRGSAERVRASLEQARMALEQLGAALGRHMGLQAPTLALIAQRLDSCGAAIDELYGERNHGQAGGMEQGGDMQERRDRARQALPEPGAGIENREQAYRMLDEAADYLLRTEPHSPAPYLVKRAVLWGDMPLNELLQELFDNEADLRHIFRLLSIRAE